MYPNTNSAIVGPHDSGFILDYAILYEGMIGCCLTGGGILVLVGLGFAIIYLIQPLFNVLQLSLNQTNDSIANDTS